MTLHLKAIVLTLTTALAPSAAFATTIYQGTIYNESGFYGGYPAVRAVNQSGLSITYTSGVTDYDTYVASSPKHYGSSSSNGVFDQLPTFIDLDFGSAITFTDFGLWNDNDYQGIKNFNILVSNNSAFSSATTLGAFTAYFNTASNPNGALVDHSNALDIQLFDLGSVTGRYVRVEVLSAHSNTYSNFGEFIFGGSISNNVSAIPEPASAFAVCGLLVSGMFLRSRKQR